MRNNTKPENGAPLAAGIDFGGTSIKMALVDRNGGIRSRKTIPTRNLADRRAGLDAMAGGIEELKSAAGLTPADPIAGVGIGVPGFVDFERGHIHVLVNVPGWDDVPLRALMEERLSLAVRVDNDVNVMALGECTYGAGKNFEHALFVTLGTGVGGALLLDGRIYRGAHSMAGEIGHMSIDMNGVDSPMGRGGLEQYIGNRRIIERAQTLMKGEPSSVLHTWCEGDPGRVTPQMIQKAAEEDDRVGLDVYDFVAECLSTAFASTAYLIQPQAIIIGGGIGLSGRVLFDPLRRHLEERLHRDFFSRLEITPAILGNDAGVIGGASLARQA